MTPATAASSEHLLEDTVAVLLKVLVRVVVVLLALPLVIPYAATAFLGPAAATRARFWITPRWLRPAAWAGGVVVGLLLTLEIAAAAERLAVKPHFAVRDGGAWASGAWAALWTVLLVNLAAGVLLVPAAFLLHRRRMGRLVTARRIPDVVVQERIEIARHRGAAWATSRRMGVRLDVRTGQITGVDHTVTAPWKVGERWGFGLVSAPSARAARDRFGSARRVRDWIDPVTGTVVLPAHASAARALVVAESGTGKTVLLNGIIACALAAGWPVFVIDAKGDPADADELVAQARAAGRSAAVGARWNLFTGTAEQVTEKLMRLLPAADGANQHYLDEARGVLGMLQANAPIRSVADLWERLDQPRPHLRDAADLAAVNAIVEPRSGLTAAGRVRQALVPALRPLEDWIDANGWSYTAPTADVTVVSLSPVDVTQARLGHLLMVDLRHFLATRLRAGDKSPVLVVVDEFPQLVTTDSDPGDAAAALLETARSAGAGLILAAQSTAGLSNDDVRRARALASGAALIAGRSKDPDLIVRYAGTVVRLESAGTGTGDQLSSGRAQNAYLIPPQEVREAWDGSFWLIQGGAVAPFRTLPPTATAPGAGHAARLLIPTSPPPPTDRAAATPPRRPMTRLTPNPTFTPPAHPARASDTDRHGPDETRDTVVGFEIEATQLPDGNWRATAYPATRSLVLDDHPDTQSVPLPAPLKPPSVHVWEWQPDEYAQWNAAIAAAPPLWRPGLHRLVERARRRFEL